MIVQVSGIKTLKDLVDVPIVSVDAIAAQGRRVDLIVEDVNPGTKVWVGIADRWGETIFLGTATSSQVVINAPDTINGQDVIVRLRKFKYYPIEVNLAQDCWSNANHIRVQQVPDFVLEQERNSLPLIEQLFCKHVWSDWSDSHMHEWTGIFGILCKGNFQYKICSKCGRGSQRQITL